MLFANGMVGNEDLGETIEMKRDNFNYVDYWEGHWARTQPNAL